MEKKYDLLVFIGRFQPLHKGHIKIIRRARELAKNVIIGIGSINSSRNGKNPFTFEERREMIKNIFPDVRCVGLNDYRYDDLKWLSNARKKFSEEIHQIEIDTDLKVDPNKIGLIGHEKDGTSFYLKMFPEWKSESVENFDNLNATEVRNHLLEGRWNARLLEKYLDSNTLGYIDKMFYESDGRPTKVFNPLLTDYLMIQVYKKSWEPAPFPPTFVTVDAVVTCSAHVLLIRRKASPGIGLSAIPGGFLDQNEAIVNGMIRELREETRLKVPEPVLIGSIKSNHVFDHPTRSERGRTITHAYHIDLGMRKDLPEVRAADDADKAMWIPLNKVDPRRMYEDHFEIISHFTGID